MARKRVHPDVLDRQSYNLFTTLFMLPGRIILWFRYIGAPKGRVFATSRQARSPVVTWFISLLFWALVIFVTYLSLTGDYTIAYV